MRRLLQKRWAIYVSGAVLALLVLFASTLFLDRTSLEDAVIVISEGGGALEIARTLEDADIISSRIPFLAYLILTGRTDSLQAGEYEFNGTYALYQIAGFVTTGTSLASERVVTIPEGFTLAEIGPRLRVEGVGEGMLTGATVSFWQDEFSFLQGISTQTLEGFMFPDTYRFHTDTTDEEVVRTMLSNFEERTRSMREATTRENSDFYRLVIFASILEREVPPEDMRRAAGVIQKRLDAGMPLQVDATLAYGLGRPIVRSDVDTFNSPYNTYQITGLPPTPISNPGLRALEAGLDPEENAFWFYLSRPDNGETIFSRTFEEHDRARARYLQ